MWAPLICAPFLWQCWLSIRRHPRPARSLGRFSCWWNVGPSFSGHQWVWFFWQAQRWGLWSKHENPQAGRHLSSIYAKLEGPATPPPYGIARLWRHCLNALHARNPRTGATGNVLGRNVGIRWPSPTHWKLLKAGPFRKLGVFALHTVGTLD